MNARLAKNIANAETLVAKRQIGSLSVSNIMTLCANHHRQMHYGDIDVVINETTFEFAIEGNLLKISRLVLTSPLEPSVSVVAA